MKDASWTQITTAGPARLEDNWVLNIPLFKAEKKYDWSSNLNFILLIFIPRKHFWLNSVINNWGKSCLESFIQSEPHDSVLAETRTNATNYFFLNVDICLKDYSSPLHIENK